MNIVRYILGVVVGFIVGQFVNIGLVTIGGALMPAPAGFDTTTVEGLKAAMPLLEPKNFIFPFLAHALGTFISALVAALIVPRHKLIFAIIFGVLGLIGGITAVVMFGGPLWYKLVDLVVAYVPFALAGGWLATKFSGEEA